MVINLKHKKKIKALKERLEYLEDCLSEEGCNLKKTTEINKTNIITINEIIKATPKENKRKFSLSILNKLKQKNIILTYYEGNLIHDYLKIGHEKINLNGYLAYYKLINNH